MTHFIERIDFNGDTTTEKIVYSSHNLYNSTVRTINIKTKNNLETLFINTNTFIVGINNLPEYCNVFFVRI